MAGARAVEEILARGGGDSFAITVFGDEPYGNYNRILLSEVLQPGEARTPTEDDLTSTRWTGTTRTASRCTPASGSCASTGYAKVVYGDDGSVTPYDTLVLATGSRSFFPPMDGHVGVDDTS